MTSDLHYMFVILMTIKVELQHTSAIPTAIGMEGAQGPSQKHVSATSASNAASVVPMSEGEEHSEDTHYASNSVQELYDALEDVSFDTNNAMGTDLLDESAGAQYDFSWNSWLRTSQRIFSRACEKERQFALL
eukprot:IDg5597t1